jgi:hypothetical protein
MKAETFVARMMPTWVDANFAEKYTIKRGIVSNSDIYSFRHCNRIFRVWPRVGVLPERFSICLEREVIAHIIGWDKEREVWEWAWVHPPNGSELFELELILP